ncbi:MAG: type II toxin-antitoxin system RelB/DinJ family antitoxin [Clostridium sp.]|jgi:DNA-damage-inducible protein J|nr:type II toxin-antitoxin system RelB/DinJ family antitoxin [Clostridium sp.]
MATNQTYNIRIDSQIRREADVIFKNMGLTTSQAVNLFLTQAVRQRRLPLTEIIADEPLSEPPAAEECHAFETWKQAKEWLNA